MDNSMIQIMNDYYKDGAKKLHKIVYAVVNNKFGGTSDKDIDEYYSEATDVFIDIIRNKRYDPKKGDFNGFLYRSLYLAFIDMLKAKNRDKRMNKIVIDIDGEKKKVPIEDLSLDMPISEDNSFTIGDFVSSDFDIEIELFKGNEYSENVREFLSSLSEMQKEIVFLVMEGRNKYEIKNELRITEKQYRDCWDVIRSYDKKRILYKENNLLEDEEMSVMSMVVEENVDEKFKNTSYSIESISKQMHKKRIRDDHILQRYSGQWKVFEKSELVSDILRGKSLTQIIISEEIKNGIKMQWLIDGRQRCTTLDDYLHDGFSISKNVKNYNITYQAPKIDDNNEIILNEEGFTDMEWKTFDIRGKKFSQLPEELQDIFKDRQIPILYNMDCNKKDIADDIARFNRSRKMNVAQTGWLGLDEEFAELADKISKMRFFQPEFVGTKYTNDNHKSGGIRRVIIESIMVSDFIDKFGDFDKMCEFLSKEASDSNFTEFYSFVERLTVICDTNKSCELFNLKDSFLFFGLFSKFSYLGLEDSRFADFINDFDSLKKIKIDGNSCEELLKENGSTKNKSVVTRKFTHLHKLMMKYFQNDKQAPLDIEHGILDFIKENVDTNITEEDVEQYEEIFDDLTLNVDNSSKLMDKQNRKSMIAIVAYSFKEDIDLDNWIIKYFREHETYIRNQKENYLHMKQDLNNF